MRDRMLEKFQPIKIAKRSYWLNGFLTKPKSILTENVLNQWKMIKNIINCGYNRNTIQINTKIYELKFIKFFILENSSAYYLIVQY